MEVWTAPCKQMPSCEIKTVTSFCRKLLHSWAGERAVLADCPHHSAVVTPQAGGNNSAGNSRSITLRDECPNAGKPGTVSKCDSYVAMCLWVRVALLSHAQRRICARAHTHTQILKWSDSSSSWDPRARLTVSQRRRGALRRWCCRDHAGRSCQGAAAFWWAWEEGVPALLGDRSPWSGHRTCPSVGWAAEQHLRLLWTLTGSKTLHLPKTSLQFHHTSS